MFIAQASSTIKYRQISELIHAKTNAVFGIATQLPLGALLITQ